LDNAATEPGREQDKDSRPPAFSDTQAQGTDAERRAFAPTEISEDPDVAPDWWSESTDGQCSVSAALFAASQPAPLNVV